MTLANVTRIARTTAPASRGRHGENRREVDVVNGLVSNQARVSVETSEHETTFTGRLVWSDINNVALEDEGRVRVFNKAHIVFWEYLAGDDL
ncbi:MAG: hypothetical protein LPL29_14455 [Alphaproteobacteria bacterium]|nr:hypothetical protein [Alphaproteobacteria bacterium]